MQHSESCEHLRDTHPHTALNGTVTTIPYCRRCGMEWTQGGTDGPSTE